MRMTVTPFAIGLALALCAAAPSTFAQSKKKAAASSPTDAAARGKLDQAIALMKSEQYGPASVALYDFIDTEKSLEDEALYNLAKSLYRMGLYHSALEEFAALLAKGPANKFHDAALEWHLFISRKIIGDER